jgi:hypothetical protein
VARSPDSSLAHSCAHVSVLEKKAKVESKTVDEKAAEIVEKKAKAKTEGFPADCRINDYGFLGFKVGWLSELG